MVQLSAAFRSWYKAEVQRQGRGVCEEGISEGLWNGGSYNLAGTVRYLYEGTALIFHRCQSHKSIEK